MKKDIWDELYREALKRYNPQELSPFISAYHVMAAIETESGKIFSGFCIEGASGVIALCAERVAALNMILNSGETVIKRIVAGIPDKIGTPCGACIEFFMQLSNKNAEAEILLDLKKKKTIKIRDFLPKDWWGYDRYKI